MMFPLSIIELFYTLGLFLSTMSDYKKVFETAIKYLNTVCFMEIEVWLTNSFQALIFSILEVNL